MKTKKKLILTVDDNKDITYSIREGLLATTKNVDVITANDGKDCLKLAKENKVDVILLDIMMPSMDGWDVAAKLKSDKATENIPIIFLTAKTDPISKGMGKLASTDYIEKPFDLDDLRKRIEKTLRRKK